MANPAHVAVVESGAQALRRWRDDNPETRLDLVGANFRGRDLAGFDLRNAALHNTNFAEANMRGANLHGASAFLAKFDDADLSDATLSRMTVAQSTLERVKLRNALLESSRFFSVKMATADLSGVNGSGASFIDSVLHAADLSGAMLDEASFDGSDASRANLTACSLRKASFVSTDLSLAIVSLASFYRANLRLADLWGVTGDSVNFDYAQLTEATLRNASLIGSTFRGARLSAVVLNDANLTRCDFTDADMSGAVIQGADLSEAQLVRANLEVADTSGAILAGAIATNEDTKRAQLTVDQVGSMRVVASSRQSDTSPPLIDFLLREALAPAYTVVELFFATDREVVAKTQNAREYGSGRGAVLELGKCEVSVPRDHRMGQVERPSIWRLEMREDVNRHVVLGRVWNLPRGTFFGQLKARVERHDKKQALVFIHGYNVGFADAARRAAQIAYDLGFQGPMILYSWPSEDALLNYPIDEGNAEWTEPHLQAFLADLRCELCATDVHLLAHSMGNRPLIRALDKLSSNVDLHATQSSTFCQIVLTAPDVDSALFEAKAVSISRSANRATLYASENDRALQLSKKIHRYPRAGDAGEAIVVVDGVETIDASALDTDFIGHSYYGDNKSVIADMFILFRHRVSPDERPGLTKLKKANRTYWQFRLGM